MRIGTHVSVARGYLHALDYAESVGGECMQFFAKSPRQWKGPAVDPVAAAAFAHEREVRRFGPIYTHTAYLINLGTDEPELRERSIAALADELVRAAVLGVQGVVTHVGNDPLADGRLAARRIGEGIVRAYEVAGDAGGQARLLLENTAGAGRSFGSTFEQLGAVISATGYGRERLGICLDTCHAFAFGMPVDSAQGWAEVLMTLDATCGLDRLGFIHANDCLFERGARRDRHAWIGDGFIGEEGFRAMVCRPELEDLDVCLEMPGEVPIKDARNIARLKAYRAQC